MNRRHFLSAMLALGAAPAIVRASSIMRVKPVLVPGEDFEWTAEIPAWRFAVMNGNVLLAPEQISREMLAIWNKHLALLRGPDAPEWRAGRLECHSP